MARCKLVGELPLAIVTSATLSVGAIVLIYIMLSVFQPSKLDRFKTDIHEWTADHDLVSWCKKNDVELRTAVGAPVPNRYSVRFTIDRLYYQKEYYVIVDADQNGIITSIRYNIKDTMP